jgi:hypothetical protein
MKGGRNAGARMTRRKQADEELIRQWPAWILPALAVLAVATFSGVFLYHYFGPTPEEFLGRAPRASAGTHKIEAIIGGVHFLIPENYTRYRAQRVGGSQPEIAMYALLPDFAPYSSEQQAEFADNSSDARAVFFTLHAAESALPAERRLKDIYARYFSSPTPEKGEDGLEKFSFRADSGYKDQDLFVGIDGNGRLFLLMCQQKIPTIESPN